MEITFESISAKEWEALADYAEREAWVYNKMAEHADDSDDSERWQLYADHQRDRRHAFKTLAAHEERDFTMYMEEKIVVTRRKFVTLHDIETLLASIAADPESEGIEKVACVTVINILNEVFDEEEEKIDD